MEQQNSPTATSPKFDWEVIVYDDTGRVIINTTLRQATDSDVEDWRSTHEKDSWASVKFRRLR